MRWLGCWSWQILSAVELYVFGWVWLVVPWEDGRGKADERDFEVADGDDDDDDDNEETSVYHNYGDESKDDDEWDGNDLARFC